LNFDGRQRRIQQYQRDQQLSYNKHREAKRKKKTNKRNKYVYEIHSKLYVSIEIESCMCHTYI